MKNSMREKLRELRKERGWRLVDLAIESGVSVSAVWLLEQGYRTTNITRLKIAEALNKRVEEVFPGEWE